MGLYFTYVLTFGGAVAALYRPFVGLLIYICFAIVKPDALWPWAVPAGNYSRIVAIALLVGWAAHGFGQWRLGKAWAVVLALLGFFAWTTVSAAFAPDQERAWHFVEEMGKIVLPCVVGVTLIDSVADLKQLAWVIVLSQGFLAYEANVSYFHGENVIQQNGLAGMTDNNGVALMMHTAMPIAFFLGLSSAGWWSKAIAFGLAALMGHAVLFSFSREGMLGLMTTGLVIFFLIPKTPKHWLVLAAAVLVAWRLSGPSVQERFITIFVDPNQRDESATSRIRLWKNCWELMTNNPVVGIGPDHFSTVAHEFGWPAGKEAHSLWFKLGAELGFVGVGCFLAYFGVCAIRLWPIARGRAPLPDPWLRDGAGMVVASIAGYVVCTQFNNLFGAEIPYYVALMGTGVLRLASVRSIEASGEALPDPLADAALVHAC